MLYRFFPLITCLSSSSQGPLFHIPFIIPQHHSHFSKPSWPQVSPPTGAALQPEKGACLDLGELQQVLLDEELARRLQEEEKLLRRVRDREDTTPTVPPARCTFSSSLILLCCWVLTTLLWCCHCRALQPVPPTINVIPSQRETSEWHKWLRMR